MKQTPNTNQPTTTKPNTKTIIHKNCDSVKTKEMEFISKCSGF